MNIALIAHDKKKEDIIRFAKEYHSILSKHQLFATGTTGMRIADEADLKVTRFQSGPLGGDQQIGAKIANEEMHMVIFFRDPLTAQPHEPDISALLRLCDVHQIPVATNLAMADIMIRALDHKDFEWKDIIEQNR
ncbi:methylglyoxal synthase [Halobacillus karajensis]|uniref:Methylglyoxal synthase n=1 Tax=Halobacillus karajensis TaxID=195088 RepID=A0A024P264_9BACI|nr:methylglyoxal synthase [Halobacillus karajensis]CDQ19519.1 Methylglyoxal synthase [Halobacillus karajensis]CDQ21981.1 Methylglyoxal synthase [Halobacillus karajensis]CDQ27822.1 Methylglyoxal synthase [Halobacillus karajensis]SEH80991.1 methylglyoxal synthase [Halobacillus karajensis]